MIKLSFKKDKQSYFGINFKLYLENILREDKPLFKIYLHI